MAEKNKVELAEFKKIALKYSWEILKECGRGGCAITYLVKDKKGKLMAAKVLDKNFKQDRTLQEKNLLKKINHPNIVSFIDFLNPEPDINILLTDYVSGETLESFILAKKTLDLRVVIEIAQKINHALGHVFHGYSTSHRDVKPSNIIIREKDSEPILIDFGIAKDFSRDTSHTTADLFQPGTVPYQSPEALNGEEPDYRSDQFSLGVTIYELLTFNLE